MRFVIHDHITETRHFDLMIETEEELLKTWRIIPSDFDMLLKGKEISGVRIQDHDKKFLTYEGLLSAGNGSVKIFDHGEIEFFEINNNIIKLKLSGQKFKGAVSLSLEKDNIYKIQHYPEA